MPSKRQHTRTHRNPTFTSHADTQELRQYQSIASKFPPLHHSELIELSRTFVKGRDAQVSLDEARVIDAVLGGDWSEDSILSHKEDVIEAYKRHIKWMSDKPSAQEIVDSFLKRCGKDITEHVDDNLIEGILWEDPISLSSVYPPIKGCSPDDVERMKGLAITTLREAVAAVKPKDVPKDVIDRWEACIEELASRYLLHVQRLPHESKQQIRKAKRMVDAGSNALSDIVNHNLQLAMSRVGRMMKSNPRAQKIGVSDLIGAANIGLILGARQFDPERGLKFSTYAAYHIDGQLHEILSVEDGKSGIKGVSPHEQKQLSTITSLRRVFEETYGRTPTVTEFQSLSGMSRLVIQKRLATPTLTTQSINSPIRQGDDDSVMLSDIIASEETIDKAVEARSMMQMMSDLKEEIMALSPSHRKILLYKSGISLDGVPPAPTTIKALSAEIGMSSQDINARYHDILENLRGRLMNRGWEPGNLPLVGEDG